MLGLFVYVLFNEDISSSEYIVTNVTTISYYLVGRLVEWRKRGLICRAYSAILLKHLTKTTKH